MKVWIHKHPLVSVAHMPRKVRRGMRSIASCNDGTSRGRKVERLLSLNPVAAPRAPGGGAVKRPYFLTPFTSGAAAYFWTFDMSHPSVQIGAAVFFTACTGVLLIRSIAQSNCTPECRRQNPGIL